MNLQRIMRVVVCAASVALCVAGAAVCPAQAVAGQGTTQPALPGAAAFDQLNRAGQASRFRAGVRNAPGRERLNADQLKQVLQSLREKTGWQALDFDEEGFLVCPAPQVFNGGSVAARCLLGAALFGTEAYELEAHNRAQAVSFARLAPGVVYQSHCTGAKLNTQALQIDFADFYELSGHSPALKAFDLGVVILHELAHGVWQLRDAASGEEEPGECETFINQIRRELQLPERQSYRARTRLGKLHLKDGTRLIAELHFVNTVETSGRVKQQRFRLQWEAETVGPIASGTRVANAATTAALH